MRNRIAMGALLVAALAITVPAFAGNGKGGGGGNNGGGTTTTTSSGGGGGSGGTTTSGSTITLDGTASFGSPATFTVVDPPVSGLPEMSVSCSQNGQSVYLDVQMMSGSSPYTPTFTLWSQTWANNGGGAADCTAQLYYYTWQGKKETGVVYMATTNFTASA
jgi:hypothetical protein